MPYSEFDGYYKIPKKNLLIWRYLESYKFDYLIENKAIYFTRVDKFHEELKEGLLTSYDLDGIRRQLYNPNNINPTKDFDDFCERRSQKEKMVFISCWMAADMEYDYMWEKFVQSSNGVVIKSSVKRLQNCFNNSKTDLDIFISETHYFHYKELLGPLNTIRQYSRKPNGFENEKEIRAILIDTPPSGDKPDHHDIVIKLEDLIDEIRISPKADYKYKLKVEEICLNNGLNFIIAS
jgi:hypothetical protein